MEEKKKRVRRIRQNWRPNLIASLLYKIWRIAFAGIKIAFGALATVLLICVVCGFVFVNVLGDYLVDDVMVKAAFDLDDYNLEETSYIYYTDGNGEIQILQQLSTTTDRRWVKYEDIPQELIHAAVAIEDKRFFEHQGVDWITTVKACAGMFFGGGGAGGSTLTQQLIKNLKLTEDLTADDVTVQRKVLEIFRAIAFEQTYDKEVVLEWYMNTVYFGNGCYGVKSAAEYYFGKELQDMNPAEMASLIGITNNPSMYDPYGKREYMFEGVVRDGAGRNDYRRKVVLTQMYEQGWLSEEDYLLYHGYTLTYKRGIADEDRWNECRDVRNDHGDLIQKGCGYKGPVRDLRAEVVSEEETVYYCPQCDQKIDIAVNASQNIYSWYVDTVLEDVAKAMAAADGVTDWNADIRANYIDRICRSGYHIYTPYDAVAQAAVDKVYTDLTKIPETKGSQQLQSAMVIVDNFTGDIVAMAGGVGEKTVADAYNRATDANRQVGSSIKPLTVYGPAFESGKITPATVVDDMPITYIDDNPYPYNDSKVYNYHRTIYQAITQSLNAVSVNTLDLIGTKYSFNFAKYKFHISGLVESFTSGNSIYTDIGIAALGMGALSVGANVRDVTSAYATFTNHGVWREGRTFLAVLDADGNVVLENRQEQETIMGQKAVDYINYCLDSAVASGTGTAADMQAELGMAVAGKTGTTQSKHDRYFAGYTGYYTAAVWCGFDIPESINLDGEVTTNPACRLWKAVMLQLHEGKESIPLYDSSKLVQVEICLDSGKLATQNCTHDIRTSDVNLSRISKVLVYPEDVPTEECDAHVMVDYCPVGQAVANEYCKHFASVGTLKLTSNALVKMTEEDMNAMLALRNKGIYAYYMRNNYIYLINKDGSDAAYFGLVYAVNEGLNVPYKLCASHTKEAWEQFLAENPWANPEDPSEPIDPTEPTEPTDPTEPTEPTAPVEPTEPTEPVPGGTEPTQQQNTPNWWNGIWDIVTG